MEKDIDSEEYLEYLDDIDPNLNAELAIERDDKNEILASIQDYVYSMQGYPVEAWFIPRDCDLICRRLMEYVTKHHALNCAAALLQGEAAFRVDLNALMTCGSFPLHLAADAFSVHLIDLYLQHGARTDVRTNGADLIYNGLLPLNVALDKLSYHSYLVDWTPKDSVFTLITILCMPQMKVPLEAIKLLAQHTEETVEEFFFCAKNGHPLQMAVLLMVARDIVLAPFRSQDGLTLNGIMSIRRCIKEEISAIIQDEIDLAGKGKNSIQIRMFKDKRAGLFSALTLLDVFEKAGESIDAYLQLDPTDKMSKDKVVEDVKYILVKAGFGIKKKDTDLATIEWVTYDGCSSDDALASGEFKRTTEETSQSLGQYLPLQSLQGGLKGKSTIDVHEAKWAHNRFFPRWTPTLSTKISGYMPNCKLPLSKTWFKSPETMKALMKRTRELKQQYPLSPKIYVPSIKHYAGYGYSLMKAVKRV